MIDAATCRVFQRPRRPAFGRPFRPLGRPSICNLRDRLWAIMAHRVKADFRSVVWWNGIQSSRLFSPSPKIAPERRGHDGEHHALGRFPFVRHQHRSSKLKSRGSKTIQLDGTLALTLLFFRVKMTKRLLPSVWASIGFQNTTIGNHLLQRLRLSTMALRAGKRSKGTEALQLHPLAVITGQDLLMKKAESTRDSKIVCFQHRPGFGKTGPHEFDRPLDLVHFRPMQQVKTLSGLRHRANKS